MKKPALILLTLMLTFSTLWGGAVAMGVTQIPHEDPTKAENHYSLSLPLLNYANAISLMACRNYSEAGDLIQQLESSHANLPEEVQFVMSRFNDLAADLTERLDRLDVVLDECEILLSQNEMDATPRKIVEARGLVAEIGSLIGNVNTAMDELILQTAPFISAREAASVQASEARLRESMGKLAQLEDWYKDLLENMESEAGKKETLTATTLTLQTRSSRAWVGESLSVWGNLIAEGVPLAERAVSLHISNSQIATVNTGRDGYYSTWLTLPYWYDVDEVKVHAFYYPEGEDSDRFSATSSEGINIAVMFHPTSVQIEAPSKMLPGLPSEIRGKVNSRGKISGRNVQALLDEDPLFQISTDDDGYFSRDIMIGEEIAHGEHSITFSVAPDNESRSAGTITVSSLDILKAKPVVTLRPPGTIFLPAKLEPTGKIFPPLSSIARIKIEGEVHSSLPLNEAQAMLEVAGASSTSFVNGGEFSVEMEVPFSFSRVGLQEIKLRLVPAEPWQLPSECTTEVLIINLAYLLVLVVVLAGVGVEMIMHRPHGLYERKDKLPSYVEEPHEPLREEVIWLPEAVPIAKENRGVILKAYYSAVAWIQKIYGILLGPQMTLRDFLNQVSSSHSRFAGVLTRLTGLAEKALYSQHAQGEDEASLAQDLSAQIKKQGSEEQKT